VQEYFIGPDGQFYMKVPNPYDRLEIVLSGRDKDNSHVMQTIVFTLNPAFSILSGIDAAVFSANEGTASKLHLGYIDLRSGL